MPLYGQFRDKVILIMHTIFLCKRWFSVYNDNVLHKALYRGLLSLFVYLQERYSDVYFLRNEKSQKSSAVDESVIVGEFGLVVTY